MEENHFIKNLKDLRQTINTKTVSSAVVASIFGGTGPALIVIGGATNGGLTYAQTISWLFACYFFAGLLGMYLTLRYRQPITAAFTVPGAVLVAGSLSHFAYNEVIGAYLVANVLVILLGMTGLIDKLMKWMPIPIVMAMIVGVMIRFAIDMINSITISPLLACSAILAYFLSSRFFKRIPPVFSALIVALPLAYFTNSFQFQGEPISFILPQLMMPAFSLDAMISIGIPLALLIICSENAQATGVLTAEGYNPPNNAMAISGSAVGLIAALFGAHAVNIAGPATAINAAKEVGKKEVRYAAGFVNGIIYAVYGLFASLIVPFVIAMPSVIIAVIAGLAMLGVLINALKTAFSAAKFQMGAFFALIIGMSGISFFNISAPLWAIIGGIFVSSLIEMEHFSQKLKAETNV